MKSTSIIIPSFDPWAMAQINKIARYVKKKLLFKGKFGIMYYIYIKEDYTVKITDIRLYFAKFGIIFNFHKRYKYTNYF